MGGAKSLRRESGCPERRCQPLRTSNPLADRVSVVVRVDECVAINAEIPLGVGRCVADDARRIRSTPGLEVALQEVQRDRCRAMSVS